MFDAAFVKEIYDNALSSDLVWRVNLSVQILCSTVLLLSFFLKILKRSSIKGQGFTIEDLMMPIIYLIAIFGYNYLLQVLDWFVIFIEELLMEFSPTSLGYASSSQVFADLNISEDISNLKGIHALVYYANRMYNYLTHPGLWVMESGRTFFIAIDALIFGIALLKRAIHMFILRIVGSFAILASFFKDYEGYTANWLKLYIINYIYVAFLFVINYFCEYVFWTIREAKLSGAEDEAGFMTTLAYLMTLFVKIGLYKKSYEFLLKVFSKS
jgi:hypothetical protein